MQPSPQAIQWKTGRNLRNVKTLNPHDPLYCVILHCMATELSVEETRKKCLLNHFVANW